MRPEASEVGADASASPSFSFPTFRYEADSDGDRQQPVPRVQDRPDFTPYVSAAATHSSLNRDDSTRGGVWRTRRPSLHPRRARSPIQLQGYGLEVV